MPVASLRELATLILPTLLVSCGGDGGAIGPAVLAPPADPFADVAQIVDDFIVDDLALVIGDASGVLWVIEKGDFSVNEAHTVASASKWMAASVLMSLVEQGVMQLDDNPQDYLDYWTSAPGDARSRVTLEQLLSFTSGFDHGGIDVSCVEQAGNTLQGCAQQLYQQGLSFEPGAAFSYGPAHLQVAGAMAEQATGQSYRSLVQLQLVAALNLAQTDVFLPSPANPRVAGGMTSTATDYAEFLRALLSGDYLSSVRDTMLEDRTASPVIIADRPDVIDANQVDFHYALGAWRECLQLQWDEECEPVGVVSSPGAFGWYPWIDFQSGYFALVAMRESNVNGQSGTAVAFDLSTALRDAISTALR